MDQFSLALLFDLASGVIAELPPLDVDEVWVGGVRADCGRSVELFVHRAAV